MIRVGFDVLEQIEELIGDLLGVLAGVPAVDVGAVSGTGVVGLERHRLGLVDYVLKVRLGLADGSALISRATSLLCLLLI